MAQTAVANSTIAGVASYPVIAAALMAVLSILGIAIPPFGIGALVVTQAMDISIASTILSYVVVHFTSDSIAQNIDALAKFAAKLPAYIPKTYHAASDFPAAPPATLVQAVEAQTPTIVDTKADAAIAVITAHATGFPQEVKAGGV